MTTKQHNWPKNESWEPAEIAYPESLEDLKQLIKKARAEKRALKAVGTLHSYSAICNTNGIQVNTDKLCRVLSIDKTGLRVKVEGGIKLQKLIDLLASHQLTLPNQGYILEQSIAGATATATHGTGKTGTLSSFIEEIELIDAQGVMHTLTPQSNAHLFSAAVMNLGCLGLIYSMTLRCIPLRKLHLKKTIYSATYVIDRLQEFTTKNEFFQVWIDPYRDRLLAFEANTTQEDLHNISFYRFKNLMGKLLVSLCFEYFNPPVWATGPSIWLYFHTTRIKSCVDYSTHLLSTGDERNCVEEEVAIPYEYTSEALHIAWQLTKRHPGLVGMIVVRFTEEDKWGYLIPTNGRKTSYITFVAFIKPGYKELFAEWEAALMKLGGRPHWGKVHTLNPEKIRTLYGEDNYQRFIDARRELDPEGLFGNEHINSLFPF